MNVVELFINTPVNAKLDIDSNLPIAIQYQVADIRDISKRNAAYSKTLVLPGTKTNNYWFGNLFDINSDFTMFNPNRKTDAKLLVNGEIVIDGFMQLRKINKETAVDFEGNRIQYECVIYNNFVDLMTELGEQTLYELDMSEYNHTFEVSSITQSWEHSWEDGYVYPMYGTKVKDFQYDIDYFKPSLFYKAVFNKILDEAGYGWTGSFRNNGQFNNEVIAFVKDGNVFIDETEKNRREWRAGVVNPTVATAGNLTNTGGIVTIGNTVVPFNNDTTTPNFDNDNHWSTTLFEWDIDRNGIYDLTYKVEFRASLINNHAYTVANQGAQASPPNYQQSLRFTPSLQRWNGTAWSTIYTQTAIGPTSSIPNVGLTLPTVLSAGASFSRDVSFPEINLTNLQLYQNQKIRLVIKSEKVGPPNGPGYSNPVQTAGFYISLPAGGGNPVSLPLVLRFNTNNSYIYNKAYQNEIVQGDILDVGVFLPDKIKQKDLISDLIKRYNLYIEVDPDNDRNLIINERPNYYDGNSTIDWTYKKDHSQPEDVQLLSELQFKSMLFSYTEDDDLYNKSYRDITGDAFGQYEYIFDNDFVKGVKEIKSPFSPTPIVKTPFGAFLPAIDPVNPKVKPRILYWGGLKGGANWKMNYQNLGTGATVSLIFTSYPYAAHWDDPINPTLDINFGGPKYTYYNDWETLTSNNMYNTYWSNYIDEIEDGRLLTANFALDETDIRFIKDNFNTKIFIKDSYYYVNKIMDYNPLMNMTTKVELIKINDGIKWIGGNSITQGIYGTVACPNDIISKKIGTAFYYVSQSGAQITQECCEAIGGTYLTASLACAVKKPIVAKPNNTPNNFKVGEFWGSGNAGNGIFFGNANKTVEATKVVSTGGSDDQILFERLDRQFVFGDNNTISGDNVVLEGGDNNDIKSTNTALLIGDSNDVSGDGNLLMNSNDNFVEGFLNTLTTVNGSTVSGSGVVVMSSNNVVASASNIFVVGANSLTATQSDSIYLGNNFVVNMNTGLSNIGLQKVLEIGNTSSLDIELEGFTSSSTTPPYTFQNFTQSGMYHAYQHPNISRVGIAVAGATSGIFKDGGLAVQDGVLLQPGYHFINDIDTGIFRSGTNELSISCGGVTASTFTTNGLVLPAGSVTNTSLRFGNMSAASGIINNFGNEMMFYSGSFRALWISGSRVIFNENATFSAPPITFGGDLDTGIFRPGANQVGIVAGGATAAVFGSTTITMQRQTLFPNKFVLYSPDGSGWEVSVNNSGVLTTSAIS